MFVQGTYAYQKDKGKGLRIFFEVPKGTPGCSAHRGDKFFSVNIAAPSREGVAALPSVAMKLMTGEPVLLKGTKIGEYVHWTCPAIETLNLAGSAQTRAEQRARRESYVSQTSEEEA